MEQVTIEYGKANGQHESPAHAEIDQLVKKTKEPTMHRMVITPEVAAILMKYNTRNRPLAQRTVTRYAKMMRGGNWKLHGQAIQCSRERLIDGQSRLQACIISGTPFETFVCFGVDDNVFDVLDCGRARTAAHIFAIHNVKAATTMAAATRWVAAIEQNVRFDIGRTSPHLPKMENKDLYDFYTRHPELPQSLWVMDLVKDVRLAPPSLLVGLHYMMSGKDEADAEAFFNGAFGGVGISQPDDPRLILHKRLLQNIQRVESLSSAHLASLICRAWNAFRAGDTLTHLKLVRSVIKLEIK